MKLVPPGDPPSFGVVASLHSSGTFRCYGERKYDSDSVAERERAGNARRREKEAYHPQSQLYAISRWSFAMWWRAPSGSLKSIWESSGQSLQ